MAQNGKVKYNLESWKSNMTRALSCAVRYKCWLFKKNLSPSLKKALSSISIDLYPHWRFFWRKGESLLALIIKTKYGVISMITYQDQKSQYFLTASVLIKRKRIQLHKVLCALNLLVWTGAPYTGCRVWWTFWPADGRPGNPRPPTWFHRSARSQAPPWRMVWTHTKQNNVWNTHCYKSVHLKTLKNIW